MEQQVRYGVLSTASILKRFINGMKEAGNGSVEAAASRTLETAERTAKEYGIPNYYGDYRELLQNPDIDAVYIPVINSLHYQYAKDALHAGKHVVMEKPFVLHHEEAEELAAYAKAHGLFLVEAIKTPFLPVYEAVKKEISEQNLGEIRFMEFHQSYTGGTYVKGWNVQKEFGGGVLYGNEAYFFRMAEYFGGRVVSCSGTASYGDTGVEEQVSLSVQLEHGALASLGVSKNILFENGLKIHLDRGRIEIPDYWKAARAVIFKDGAFVNELNYPHTWEFSYELRHYNECMLKGWCESPVNPLENTIRYITFCEELYRRWESGQPNCLSAG